MLRKDVLRRKKDFSNIYKKGKSKGDRYVVVFSKKNGLEYNRISFLASKKVGNSVERNRARRLMKESMRLSGVNLKKGYDIVIIARNTITKDSAKEKDVRRSLNRALKKTGVAI